MSRPFSGGCLCEAVRYECEAQPVITGHCHCTDCRKSSGTGHSSHLGVPRQSVTIGGKVSQYDRAADSGNMAAHEDQSEKIIRRVPTSRPRMSC